MAEIQLVGSYDAVVTLPDGDKKTISIKNMVKRDSIVSLIMGQKVVDSLALGKSVIQPTFDEPLDSIEPVKLVPIKTYSVVKDLNNYQIIHKWVFEINDTTILTDITELGVGVNVDSNFNELSRVILTRNGRLVKLNKARDDKLTITYTLSISVSNNDNDVTTITLNNQPYSVTAFPLAPIVKHLDIAESSIVYYQFIESPTNVLPAKTIYDETYLESAVVSDDIETNSYSVVLNKIFEFTVPENSSKDLYGLLVFTSIGSIQYHFTPAINIVNEGHIKFEVKLRITNG